jgi:hypothetical protein
MSLGAALALLSGLSALVAISFWLYELLRK